MGSSARRAGHSDGFADAFADEGGIVVVAGVGVGEGGGAAGVAGALLDFHGGGALPENTGGQRGFVGGIGGDGKVPVGSVVAGEGERSPRTRWCS